MLRASRCLLLSFQSFQHQRGNRGHYSFAITQARCNLRATTARARAATRDPFDSHLERVLF